MSLMGCLVDRLEQDVPALAIGPRSAGKGHCHGEVQRGDLPPLLRAAGLHRDTERLQQVLRRLVIAVLVLDALENGEFAPRSHVDLEDGYAVDDVVVDALRVLPVAFAARL